VRGDVVIHWEGRLERQNYRVVGEGEGEGWT